MSVWQAAAILAGCSIGVGVLLLLVVFCLKLRMPAGGRDKAATRPVTNSARNDTADLARQIELAAEKIDRQIAARLGELRKLLAQAEAATSDLDARLMRIGRGWPGTYQAGGPGPDTGDDPDGRVGDRHVEILRLHDQGMDPLEIARQTGENLGEVQLVLNLHASQPPSK